MKDEAHIIHESLSCTLPLIDTYCIVDTGSSDDTISKIQEFYAGKGIQGEIHERPWVDFGTNRSQALELCNGKMDYILVIDADDLMTFPENGRQQLETILTMEKPNGLQIHIHQTTIKYWRTQVFKADDGWKYVGVLHEYPTNGAPTTKIPKLPETFWMESRRLGGRTRAAGNKAERDIAVLEKGLEAEPANERYMFYLAQSYRDAGKHDKACEMYKKRFRAGGWAEESWFAAYRVGDCYRQLGNIPKFEYWMQKAYALRPWRAEPLYQLVEHFRKTNGFHKAYHYLEMGRKREKRNDDVLFVETFPNNGGFEYEATILDYYVHSDRTIGLRDSVKYMLSTKEYQSNVLSNLKFYTKPIPSSRRKLDLPNPFGHPWRPSAISVIKYPLANVRYVNYLIPTKSEYKTADGSPIQTYNAVVNLETMEYVVEMKDDVSLPRSPSHVRGLEDIRVYQKGDESWFTATNYREYSKDISILHGRYGLDGTYSSVSVVQSPTKSAVEKNWTHIPGTGLTIYSWSPLRIGTIRGPTYTDSVTHTTPPLFSLFRGSASPVRIGSEWVALVHFVEYATPRNYYHCFVKLDDLYRPIAVSLPFTFGGTPIEFCTSMIATETDVDCFVSFMDANPERVSTRLTAIEWISLSIQESTPTTYWAGQYSTCLSTGSIHAYIASRSNDVLWIPHDGVVSDDVANGTQWKDTKLVPSSVYDAQVSSDTTIVPALCSRGMTRKSMVYVPLDDETFQHGLTHILSKIPSPKWKDRMPVAFWRGGASGFEHPSVRMRVVRELLDHPSCDVRLTKWGGWENRKDIPESHFGDRCSLEKHFRHKYLLIVDGNCIASNHQWVFGSGSVPIMVTHPDNDYWFKRYLKPMVHYVPIQYDLSDLRERIDWLIANDDKAREIAENAQALANTIFEPGFQKDYIDMELGKRSHLVQRYEEKCKAPSDINEHLPTLLGYAKKCTSIVECGVREIVSSYAFASGLIGTPGNSYVLVDPMKSSNIESFLAVCSGEGVNARFVHESDLTCPLIETDLLFIDTWHVYAQLKRELAYWHSSVKKYIILHDTTVDAVHGETVRCHLDAEKASREFGYPINEIKKGLWPAVEEFLSEHREWVIEKRYTNNNGLTILARV